MAIAIAVFQADGRFWTFTFHEKEDWDSLRDVPDDKLIECYQVERQVITNIEWVKVE